MKLAAVIVFTALSAAVFPAQAASPLVKTLQNYGLFGRWAIDCSAPAAIANPHVRDTLESNGQVLERHDLGADTEGNFYRIVAAKKQSATRLSLSVIFQPGSLDAERQKLEYLVRDGTRRTMANQPEKGDMRVRDGFVLGAGIETPVLKKCE